MILTLWWILSERLLGRAYVRHNNARIPYREEGLWGSIWTCVVKWTTFFGDCRLFAAVAITSSDR